VVVSGLDHVRWTFFVFPFVVPTISGWVVWIVLAVGSCGFDLRVYMPWIDRGVLYFRELEKDLVGLDYSSLQWQLYMYLACLNRFDLALQIMPYLEQSNDQDNDLLTETMLR
jgi:hypothetical protein